MIPEEQDKVIFSKIWEKFTLGKSPEKEHQPNCVIVGGVPASGKTRVLTGYEDKNYVQIDIDSLRSYHPKYNEWKYDQMMAKWTNLCADKWYSRLIEECGRKGYNMVIETTLKTDEWIKVAGAFKNAGYKVDVDTIACPIDQSVLSAHTRYEKNISQYGYGRYVFFSVVKDSYDGLPAAMDALVKSGVPGRCEIHSRRELLGVANQNTDAQKIIAAERIRPKTAEEYTEMKKGWDSVSEWMSKRGATPAEYEQLHDFISGAVSIMEKDGYTKENIDFLKNVLKGFENNKINEEQAYACELPNVTVDNEHFKIGDTVHFTANDIVLTDHYHTENHDIYGEIVAEKDGKLGVGTLSGVFFKNPKELRPASERALAAFNKSYKQLAKAYKGKMLKQRYGKFEITEQAHEQTEQVKSKSNKGIPEGQIKM